MSVQIKEGSIGHILYKCQIITDADITSALEEQERAGCRFGEALVRLGIVTQEDIDWALSNQLDIPYIRLSKDMFDPDAVQLVTAGMARTYSCIPLIRAGNELNIAIADPLNKAAVAAIEQHTGCVVNISVALLREIREMHDEFYGPLVQDIMGFASPVFSDKLLQAINSDLSGATLLDYLVVFTIQNRLSSLSLKPFAENVIVTGKRAGTAHPIGTLATHHYPELLVRLRKLTRQNSSTSLSSTGFMSFQYRTGAVRFQVGFMKGVSGDYVTIRPSLATEVPSRMADLPLPPSQREAFMKLASVGRGITFFASRSFHERCRFMDMILEEAAPGNRNVLVFGDGPGQGRTPFPRVQFPSEEHARASLVLDSLDHDLDIMVIEDITGAELFSAACRAAMRGKKVVAGIGIRGTENLLQHLINACRSGALIPAFVNGLVSFKGIHILCGECRTSVVPSADDLSAMALASTPAAFYTTRGCEACTHTGFRERRFLLDVVNFDNRVVKIIETANDGVSAMIRLRDQGFSGIREEGLRLLNAGDISPDEYVASIVF